MKTAREEQIENLRSSAEALRTTAQRTRDEAAEWQRSADKANEKADRDEENALVWERLADALDHGQLDDIVVPLGTGRNEPTNARIHALQGRIMSQLHKYQLDAWNIHCGELRAMLHHLHGGSRESIAFIADRLGIAYAEEPRSDGQLLATAKGEIDGIEVKIWSLLPVEDEHPVPVVEHVDYAEADAVREIEREMAIEAGDDSEIDRQVAEDDARNERKYEAHEANEAWLDAHPDEFVDEGAETKSAQEAWIAQREAAVDEALDARGAESGS